MAGTSHINAYFTNYGEHSVATGRPAAQVSPNQVYVASRYAFQGALKGLSINLGGYFYDKTPIENPDAGLSYNSSGVLTKDNLEWNVKVPGYYVVNGGIRYKFRTGKFSQTIGLNINNMMNRAFIDTSDYLGDSRTFLFNYTIQH
jgi:hypothetical protein